MLESKDIKIPTSKTETLVSDREHFEKAVCVLVLVRRRKEVLETLYLPPLKKRKKRKKRKKKDGSMSVLSGTHFISLQMMIFENIHFTHSPSADKLPPCPASDRYGASLLEPPRGRAGRWAPNTPSWGPWNQALR